MLAIREPPKLILRFGEPLGADNGLGQKSGPDFFAESKKGKSETTASPTTNKKDLNRGDAGFLPYGQTFFHALCLQADNGLGKKNEPDF